MVDLQQLQAKVFGGKTHDVEVMVAFLRDMGCVADVIGRDYEIIGEDGKVAFRIRQKGMTIPQYKFLFSGWKDLKKLENTKSPGKGKR